MPERVPVVVVGAGPAGLAASQQLGQRRIAHRVLERGDTVGYSWANLYDSLTLHTGKHMSHLPGLPFPPSAPVFLPRREFWEYLRHYARTFGLPIETNCAVEQITRANGGWRPRTPPRPHHPHRVGAAPGRAPNPHHPHPPPPPRVPGPDPPT